MTLIEIACQLIPGYGLLTEEERHQFAETDAGKAFEQMVKLIQEFSDDVRANQSWFSRLTLSKESEIKIKTEIEARKKEFSELMTGNEAYRRLRSQILYKIIIERFPELRLSSSSGEILDYFYQSELMQSLGTSDLLELENQIQELKNIALPLERGAALLYKVGENKEIILRQWYQHYLESDELAFFRLALENQKEEEKAERLKRVVQIVPAFDVSGFEDSRESVEEEFHDVIEDDLEEFHDAPDEFLDEDLEEKNRETKLEEELTCFLFEKLQNAVNGQISFMDLVQFNLNQANHIAKRILAASKLNEEITLDNILLNYKIALSNQISDKLKIINGKKIVIHEPPVWEELSNSLSYLFWNSHIVKSSIHFINQLSDAHLFLAYTGATSQNDSYTVLLDLINAGRLRSQVIETKTIFISLFKPFLPLYEEMRDIAFREKNYFRKLFRTLMPLLIIAGFVVLVGALLAPLAIPEFAFLIAVIPTFFIGLALATFYVVAKNTIHQKIQLLWYGDAFEIPQYQVNDRMIDIFGTQEMAEFVRAFYIEEIKQCDRFEKECQQQRGRGQINPDERKANIERRHLLNLEWYDIHSNESLAVEKVKQIVINRLITVGNEEYQKLMNELAKNDMPQIVLFINTIGDELEHSLVSIANHAENEVDNINAIQPDEDEQENVEAQAPLNPPAEVEHPAGHSLHFFPRAVRHRDKATEIACLREAVEAGPRMR